MITTPARWKIAVLAEAVYGVAQLFPRGLHARSASENASDPFRRVEESALEPVLKGFGSEHFSHLR